MPDPDLPDAAGGRRTGWTLATTVMVLIAVGLVALAGYGVRERRTRATEATPTAATPGDLLDERQSRGTSLPGVGRVRGLALPCTAWLIEPDAAEDGTDPDPSAAAHAVTAGRCTGIEDGATVLDDVAVDEASIAFRTFAPSSSGDEVEPVEVGVTEIVWAAVRGTDLAVLRLDATYTDLAARGVPAIQAVAPPPQGAQILVAGVPVPGIPDDQARLRGSRCAAGHTTDVADGPWILRDAVANDCRGLLEGSAGSPAFDASGRAVGMVASSTIGAQPSSDCARGRPCEIGGGSVSFHADTSYLVGLEGVGACLAPGEFELGGSCPLEDPSGVVVASVGSSSVPADSTVEVQVEAGSPQPAGRLVGTLGSTDCWAEDGWTTAITDADGTLRVTAPTAQGLALLCVGSAAQPTPIRLEVSGSAPDAGAIVLDQVPVMGGVLVQPVADPPRYSTFTWLIGPAGATDCATAEGYVTYTGEPAFIEAADLPATVCVIASDESGTPSAPQAFEVG